MYNFLVDSHCHLNMKEFNDDLDNVIERAINNDVKYLHSICTKISDYPEIISIIEKYDNIHGSFGIHPHEADHHLDLTVEQIINYSSHPKIISVGETGLDYYYEYSNRLNQQTLFKKHIEASRQNSLPIIIHTREADNDTISILTEEMKKGEFKGLIHCFTSTEELARKVLDLGLYISISGIVTFKKAVDLQDIVKFLPLDRILIETDSPYLAPIPFRGKRNEPAFVKNVCEFIATLKNIPYETLRENTTKNYMNLFSKIELSR
jgi:TatD DNase family protein